MIHVHPPRARGPQGPSPLSSVTDTGPLVFVSGQVPSTPQGTEPPTDITGQTRLVLSKIQRLLREAGLDLADVAKVTVFVTDLSLMGAVNEVYREFFDVPYPARSAVGVALGRPEFLVEIEAIAVRAPQRED